MQHTPDNTEVRVGSELHVSGGTIGAILPNAYTDDKRRWQTICRAWRSERDQALLELHRKRLSAYLDNVVQFGGER